MKILKWVVLALLCSFAFILVAGWAAGLRQRSRAAAFLESATEMKPGEATIAGVRQLAIKFDGKAWDTVSQSPAKCTDEKCTFRFDFANPRNRLPAFFRATRVLLSATLYIQDGILDAIDVAYSAQAPFGNLASYDVIYSKAEISPTSVRGQRYEWKSPGYGVLRAKAYDNKTPWVIEVHLDERATASQKDRAYSLDVSCIGRLFGCSGPSAVVPPDMRTLWLTGQ